MIRVARAALAGGGVAMALGCAALAQTPIDDSLGRDSARRMDNLEKTVRELRAIVFQGRETGAPVVVQPADTQSQLNAVTDRQNDLDRTLTRLNGEMEVVRHDLDQTRQDNADLRAQNAALKAQLDDLQQKLQAPPPAPVAEAPPPAPPPADTPASAWAAAHGLWQSGDNAGAEAAFRDFTERFGDNFRAPEARYYLGKTLAARRAWPEAATADIGAIRGWPQTRWAPDAVLDLARALAAMGKTSDACQTLTELAKRYPRAPASVMSGARQTRQQAACG